MQHLRSRPSSPFTLPLLLAVSAAVAAGLAAPAMAQHSVAQHSVAQHPVARNPVDVLVGKAPNAQYGSSVTSAGDVDGDGYPDLVVGAAIDNRVSRKSGALEVRSGRDRKLLYTWLGAGPGDELGFAGAGAGDVDGDGHDDILVACIGGVGYAESFIGHARVYSGRTGERLHVFAGEQAYDFYGLSVGGVTDLDGDGCAEVAIGCPGADLDFENQGKLEIRSGKTGELMFELRGAGAHDQFGWFCRSLGDIDHDGVADFAVGAPGHLHTDDNGVPTHTGYVHLVSGKSGHVLRVIKGEAPGDRFGWNLAAIGDADGDGAPDLVVGAPFRDHCGAVDAGAFYICSGATGAKLVRVEHDEPGAEFGWCVHASLERGDYDGDGKADIWVTARHSDLNGEDSGASWLWSGTGDRALLTIPGRSAGDESGYSIVDLGPMPDADGTHEVVIGARSDDVATGQMVGSANIYRVRPAGHDDADPLPTLIAGDARVERFAAADIAPSEAVVWFDAPKGRLSLVLGALSFGALLLIGRLLRRS